MEEWVIQNIQSALTEGNLKSPIPEQKQMN